MSQGIIDMVEVIKCLLSRFSEIKLEYGNKIINEDVDDLIKMAHR